MKPFRFSLDTLLKVQEQRLKVLKKDLFEMELNKKNLSKEMVEIKNELTEIKQKKCLKKDDFFYRETLQMNLKEVQKKLEKAIFMQKNKKKETEKALQMRKIVAKMKESRYSIWYEKQHILDEE